jgi:uncharacterized protein (DUF4415 family)
MSKTDKNLTYTVTQQDYEEELADGVDPEDAIKPGTYKVRRSPWAEKLKNSSKVKVSIYLDSDVVQYFRGRADQSNAAPYQTQINSELRKVMEAKPEISSVEKSLLNDKKFLKELKKRLETV